MRLALILLVIGCTEDAPKISEEVACSDYVKAVCGQFQSCSAASIKLVYGDQTTCETRLKGTCKSALHDPGTTLTTNRLDLCAQKLMASTCTALSNHVIPDECKPLAGTLADGTPCGDDGQCKSAFCKKPAKSTCGVCAAKSSTCVVEGDCDSGLVCAASTCVMRAAQGAACDAAHPCAYGLICDAAVCKTPPGAGMACTPSTGGGNCDQVQGNFCNPVSMVCQAFGFANAGEPCGLVNQGYSVCASSGHCTSMLQGNCLAFAADGAACNDTNGPDCMPPAQCVSAVCTIPDTSTCK